MTKSRHEQVVERVTSLIYVACGSVTPQRAEQAARELMQRGWIAEDRVDVTHRENSWMTWPDPPERNHR